VVVGVIDSGIDAMHIDLNVVGNISFIDGNPALPNDSLGYVDNYGHGTHVSSVPEGSTAELKNKPHI